MPKNSSPVRGGSALMVRMAATFGAGTIVGGASLTGQPTVGAVLAAAIVVGPLIVDVIRTLTQRQVAQTASEIARNSDEDAVKRIGALADVIDKLR
ncbi:hypothetical protein [Micromonospora sp. DT229]|uniref:hypothetical protein n=1 Tax=Micromonospora sp. DT229 TaxID=3393430 RepID=UPI003CE96E12